MTPILEEEFLMKAKFRLRRLRLIERKLLRFYSAWQETHRLEFVDKSMQLVAEILRLNPHYSIRHPFERAF